MSKTFAGARLRRLREERRISQIDLARQLNISPSWSTTATRWRSGLRTTR
jgi:transcriptional regulator with XRE-family HTH domain